MSEAKSIRRSSIEFSPRKLLPSVRTPKSRFKSSVNKIKSFKNLGLFKKKSKTSNKKATLKSIAVKYPDIFFKRSRSTGKRNRFLNLQTSEKSTPRAAQPILQLSERLNLLVSHNDVLNKNNRSLNMTGFWPANSITLQNTNAKIPNTTKAKKSPKIVFKTPSKNGSQSNRSNPHLETINSKMNFNQKKLRRITNEMNLMTKNRYLNLINRNHVKSRSPTGKVMIIKREDISKLHYL